MGPKLLAAATVVGLALAGSANAATYISYFDTKNDGTVLAGTSDATSYGKVTIVESANLLTFTVTLMGEVGFLNTGNENGNFGGNKQPFSFNANNTYTVTPQNTLAGQQFVYAGHTSSPGSYENTPFGTFNDAIYCCGGTGGSNYDPAPLKFTLAGTGVNISAISSNTDNGGLTVPGANNGWWFAADVITAQGATFTIAAKDIRVQITETPVPEPATWGLMIVGFGAAGAMIRRRRTVAA